MFQFYNMIKSKKSTFRAIDKRYFRNFVCKNIIRKSLICLTFFIYHSHINGQGQGISFSASLQEVYDNSNILQISEKKTEIINSLKDGINSAWWPSINILGGYTWMSNDINVSQQYKTLLAPFDEYFDRNIISQEIGKLIYNFLGDKSFTVPIIDNQWASIDAVITYPIFAGGKRLAATKIGNELMNIGKLEHLQVSDGIFLSWVEIYYGYQLSKQYEIVKKENYNSLKNHFEEVVSFQANGIANQMDYLVAKVAMDEAEREYKSAQRHCVLLKYSFCNIMGHDSTCNYYPISSFFIYKNIPELDWFIQNYHNSPIVKILDSKNRVAKNTIKINQGDYLPVIAIFGKQNLASYNMPQNLSPRSTMGATLTWTIFDGLARKQRVKQSKIELEINKKQYNEAEKQLKASIHKAYYELLDAEQNIKTLSSTLEMTEELIRIRKVAYSEGMATASEVVDALLANSKVQLLQLSAYYQYDLMLATLLTLCGMPEYFEKWSIEQ